MKYVDVHAHMNEFSSYEKFLEKNKDIVVINNGLNSKSNLESLELGKKFSNVKVALGIYPTEVKNVNVKKEIEFIKENKKNIVAIGEIGLDKKDSENFNEQKKVFVKMIELSLDLKLPVIVHSRLAEKDVVRYLEEYNVKKVVMHSFMGNFKLVNKIIENNWMLSIPSIIDRSEHFQKIVIDVGVNNLLTETDTPYLGDSKFHGPKLVKQTIKKISKIKNVNEETIRKKVFSNYKKTFL
ncbi:hypothetical protein CL617_00330 [archaeon]|nr:hypothetical protein [archaeon]|tara:strand:- start:243 stop:959 length:717 start_codon:yes stop_codon:yes gene_type:complete